MSNSHALHPCVALTGATGFVGGILAQQLNQSGIRVLALLREEASIPGCECVAVGDLEQASDLNSVLRYNSRKVIFPSAACICRHAEKFLFFPSPPETNRRESMATGVLTKPMMISAGYG